MNADVSALRNGVLEIALSSWPEFHQEVAGIQSPRGYAWRGQRKDWPLLSTFDRKVKNKDQQERANSLKRHLDRFKTAMTKYYPNVLPKDDWDTWALGQHYDLKTPLLDWTSSPYIAAYFAFIAEYKENDPEDRYRYIYGLNRSIERLLSIRKKASQTQSKERFVPFIDRLPYPNPRFTAQRGVFTKAFQGGDIRDFVRSFSSKRPSETLMVTIRIPARDRQICLSDLHLMSIDHMSLLLDLRQVVDECNSMLP